MDDLIRDHLYIAKYIARKYKNNNIPYEDLVQEGYIGLIQAVKHFDPDRGVKFSTYATFWVKQAILDAVTSKSRTIRLPAHIVQLKLKVFKFMENFILSLGYEPDVELIAKELQEPVAKIRQVLELTTEHTGDWEVQEDNDIEDVIEHEDEIKHAIEAIRGLSDKEKLILGMKFGFLKSL